MISLLGGVALFLFGMTLMGDGLKKVAGNKLEIILYKLTSTPLKGVLLGTGVTAVIQSSSATSVMVVGFVNSGMMQVRQAIGIVLGSILGTSITGWILCLSDISGSGWVSLLSTATLTGVVAVVGIVLRMFCKDLTKHHIGDILLGFAVLMYGMSSMSGAVAPLKDSAAFIQLLTRFSNPLLGVLVGTVFTCILQSASAAVGILQALAITGTITFSVAFPITLGIAIGAGADVALDAADVVLMKSRLSDVPAAIRLSRATLRNIHQHLFWAFFYNTLGIPLAAGVFVPLGLTLNPMFGAAAMSLSSFCVVSNALRLNLFKLRDPKHDHKRRKKPASANTAPAEEKATTKKEKEPMKKTMKIEGMMCAHCEATVKKALEAIPEVVDAEVSHTAGTAVVTLQSPVDDAALKKAVEDKDYKVLGIE